MAARLVDGVLTDAAAGDGALIAAAAVRFVGRDYQGAFDCLDRAMARGGALLQRAVADRVRYASLLGWDQEVREALGAAISIEPDEPRWYALATRAFVRAGATEHALEAARRALALEPRSARMGIEVARLLAELGRNADAVEQIEAAERHVPAGSLRHVLGMAFVLRDAGAIEAARARFESALSLDPAQPDLMLELAELALWQGDTTTAMRWADQAQQADPGRAGVARVHGVVAMLEHDPARAASHLDRAIALDASDALALYWRAEAAYRLKQWDTAHELLSRATMQAEGFLFVAWILRFLVVAGNDKDDQPVSARRVEELRRAVEEIVPGAREAFERGSEGEIVQCLEHALRCMRGNRTTTPTFVDEAGVLRRVMARTGVRHASRTALQLIRTLPPAEVVAALDVVVARHPDAALPVCHRGELHLWLGDLERARADLESALALDRFTRWAYIGLTGIDILEGDPEQALRTSEHGVRTMGNTAGPAVYAYRGEAHRLLGHHAEARADLERAIELTPTRIGAWIDLALVHAATRQTTALDRIWEHLELAATGLLSDASREVDVVSWGDPGVAPSLGERQRVLERALAMMRGNRSTSCATYFTREGRLRFVQPYAAHAKRTHDEDARTLDAAEALVAPAR